MIHTNSFNGSLKISILMRIGRGAAAEELHWLGRLDLMPRSGGDENAVAGAHFPFLTIDFHHASSLEEVIQFFTHFVVMPFGLATRRKSRFGQALIFDRRVAEIEQTPDRRAIFGSEGSLLIALSDFHSPW